VANPLETSLSLSLSAFKDLFSNLTKVRQRYRKHYCIKPHHSSLRNFGQESYRCSSTKGVGLLLFLFGSLSNLASNNLEKLNIFAATDLVVEIVANRLRISFLRSPFQALSAVSSKMNLYKGSDFVNNMSQ